MRRVSELSNKIRVVSESLKDRNSASLGVWVSVGGRYETDAHKGIAHYLEHMAFKGSAGYSCDAIKQTVEGVGGSLNAFTGEEETCFYAKVPSKHLRSAFDVLADITFFPKLNPKDIEKERTVILEEIKMYHDLPQYYVGELLEELLWPDHPLGKSLAGSDQSVRSIKQFDLKTFHATYYHAGHAVIAACGAVKHDDLVAWVRAKLGHIKPSVQQKASLARKEQDRPGINLYYKQTEQMHLALGYLAYENDHPDYYALALLSIILGGNMSSRLFNEVREKRGLAYSISSGIKALGDTGVFMVRAGLDNAKIVPALDLILNVLERIGRQGVSDDEFRRAKDYYLGQSQLALEDTLDHMLWVGSLTLHHDKVRSMKDVIKRVVAVKKVDLKRVAAHVFARNRINCAIIGPLDEPVNKQLQAILTK